MAGLPGCACCGPMGIAVVMSRVLAMSGRSLIKTHSVNEITFPRGAVTLRCDDHGGNKGRTITHVTFSILRFDVILTHGGWLF